MATILRTELDDGIARITIDNPPVNALPTPFYDACADQLLAYQSDDAVRSVVITGAGSRAFCAGQDTREIATADAGSSEDRKRRMQRAMSALRWFPKPVVAALNGPVVGAGAMLASLSDVVIAVDHASIRLPEIDVGVVGGARHTLRVLPQPVVRRMILTGEPLPAAEALRLGCYAEIVPAGSLLERADEIARVLASKDPGAVAIWKRTLLEAEELDLEAGWSAEQHASVTLERDFPRD